MIFIPQGLEKNFDYKKVLKAFKKGEAFVLEQIREQPNGRWLLETNDNKS